MTKRALIQVWYTEGSGPPPALEPGELAYSDADQRLYVGRVDGSISALPAVVTWGDVQGKPTTMSQLGITLAVGDVPAGYDYLKLTNRPDISALDELEDYSDLASFPTTGDSNKLYIALNTGLFYRWHGSGYTQLTGRAAIFGEISGDPDNQANLKAKFDALQAQLTALVTQVENQKYKVGDIYTTTDSTAPGTRLGYGTWEAYGAGRVLVGHSPGDPDFGTVGGTGGAKNHTLTEPEMPSHDHGLGKVNGTYGTGTSSIVFGGGTDRDTGLTGGGQPHNNLQPYITVYIWRRTA